MYVTAIHDGDYIRVRNVDFKKGAKSFEAVAASSSSGGQIEIRLDNKEGTLIGTCVIGNTGGPESWKTFQAQVDKVKGVHDVYFIFRGGEDELFNFDCWKFIRQRTVKALVHYCLNRLYRKQMLSMSVQINPMNKKCVNIKQNPYFCVVNKND